LYLNEEIRVCLHCLNEGRASVLADDAFGIILFHDGREPNKGEDIEKMERLSALHWVTF
jgi:hypothetical protein